jgi:DNA-binding MltR family transcriptional regulator
MGKRRIPESSEDVKGAATAFLETIKAESDRGSVLVAAAFLDEALELLLRSKMKAEEKIVKQSVDPLLTGIGPLRSFWARTELCRALDFVADWEYEDLCQIRGLRNLFAHSYERADFDDPRVIALVMKLNAFGERTLPWGRATKREDEKEARKRFSLAAAWLAGTLHRRAGMKDDV